MHNGLLRLGGEKMSKSIGNIITIKEALAKFSSDAIRIFILGSHYRSPLTYSSEALEAAEKGAARLRQALESSTSGGKSFSLDIASARKRFIESMDDDFNTPQALAVLFDLTRELNRLRDEGEDISLGQGLLKELSEVLGLTLRASENAAGGAGPFIQLLLDTRNGLRKAKQYQLADDIRKRLEELGVAIEDTAGGTTWKVKR
jgi:cysteinyl-tRNA synthetase